MTVDTGELSSMQQTGTRDVLSSLTQDHHSEEVSVVKVPIYGLVPRLHTHHGCDDVHDGDSLQEDSDITSMPESVPPVPG